MKSFRHFIEKYTPLTDAEWLEIFAVFEPIELNKNQMLLQQGKICRHLYFIESGMLRFYILKDGNDITKFFTIAPYCFTSQVSFTAQKPAADNIQAIEKSMVWQTSLQNANALLVMPAWNTFIRKLIQEVQSFTESILEEIQTETAEKRYEKLLQNSPDWVSRIPLKYLASYLGIAPQSLSRIRKNYLAKSRS